MPTTNNTTATTTDAPKRCTDCNERMSGVSKYKRCFHCHAKTMTGRCTATIGGRNKVACGKACRAGYDRCYGHRAVPYTHCRLCGGHLVAFRTRTDFHMRDTHKKCWLAEL